MVASLRRLSWQQRTQRRRGRDGWNVRPGGSVRARCCSRRYRMEDCTAPLPGSGPAAAAPYGAALSRPAALARHQRRGDARTWRPDQDELPDRHDKSPVRIIGPPNQPRQRPRRRLQPRPRCSRRPAGRSNCLPALPRGLGESRHLACRPAARRQPSRARRRAQRCPSTSGVSI